MEELITATGKKYLCDYLVTLPFPAQAYIRIIGASLVEVSTVFSNPAETARIQYGDTVLEGYSAFQSLVMEPDAIRIVLGRK